MFDPVTADLIKTAPAMTELDLSTLPQELTKAFVSIVSARINLRDGDVSNQAHIKKIHSWMRKLGAAQEAYVALLPQRENRMAAAFVAASAHQTALRIEHPNITSESTGSYLTTNGISSDISAALLYLIAESAADAMEAAKHITSEAAAPIERALMQSIKALAQGDLTAIAEIKVPQIDSAAEPIEAATQALWSRLLSSLKLLATQLLDPDSDVIGLFDPVEEFEAVKKLSVKTGIPIPGLLKAGFVSVYVGPHHLASLLSSTAKDLRATALVYCKPPTDVDEIKWKAILKHIAKKRPFLWRNHREAIKAGCLEPGVSAALSFPTGAGKTTLAELKIAAALLQDKKVIYLAPTHALIDQITGTLQAAFPTANVERERVEEVILDDFDTESLPSISIMTPEKCLALMSYAPEFLDEVGLLIFDECHLMHPRSAEGDRRSIDAMLTLLNFTAIAPEADLLLLSAMMNNAEQIAAWIEVLTQRKCLSLTLDWRPTRQARGCIIYSANETGDLTQKLNVARRNATTQDPPAQLKRELLATPLVLFSLQQTWLSTTANDYALLRLFDQPTALSTGTSDGGRWYLTSNRYQTAAEIAARASKIGLKTLIFVQNVPSCEGTAKKIRDLIEIHVTLLPHEKSLLLASIEECGDVSHTYASNDPVCVSHHALLLPQERRLHESLFKRKDGLNCMIATSTLAQGMNLPSDMVIIAGDDRFDALQGRPTPIEAHELLNAAGRAGRAGEAAQGMVLIVPSKVISFDQTTGQIERHWHDLKDIFANTDQCLEITDPIAAVLDQVHASASLSPMASYLLGRLPLQIQDNGQADVFPALRKTFAAYQAQRRGDTDWIESRIAAARPLFEGAIKTDTDWRARLAATSGVSINIVASIDNELHANGLRLGGELKDWTSWAVNWLLSHSEYLPELLRPETLNILSPNLRTENWTDSHAQIVISKLKQLIPMWLEGATLIDIERVMSSRKPGYCVHARGFVLKVIPELSYVFGIISQVHKYRLKAEMGDVVMPIGAALLRSAIRYGFNESEKIAMRTVLGLNLSRLACSRELDRIRPKLQSGHPFENYWDVVYRIREALVQSPVSDSFIPPQQ